MISLWQWHGAHLHTPTEQHLCRRLAMLAGDSREQLVVQTRGVAQRTVVLNDNPMLVGIIQHLFTVAKRRPFYLIDYRYFASRVDDVFDLVNFIVAHADVFCQTFVASSDQPLPQRLARAH